MLVIPFFRVVPWCRRYSISTRARINDFVIQIEDPEKENFYIDSMLSEKVSELIIAPSKGNTSYLKKLNEDDYPIVCVDRYPNSLHIDTVTIDNEKGAYLAV